MTTLNSFQDKMDNIGLTSSFYRVQGGNSCKRFLVYGNDVLYDDPNNYIYFSGDLKHHLYFYKKRLRQLCGSYSDSHANSIYQYSPKLCLVMDNIKNVNNLKINLESFSFCFYLGTLKLIKENSINNSFCKLENNLPKRADIRIKGGGYGLKGDWLRLFYLSNFLTSVTYIEKEDILEYLNKLQYCNQNRINLLPEYKKRFYLNKDMLHSYSKYEVKDVLENIVLDKNLIEESSLCREPSKTIKNYIKGYEKARKCALRLLDSEKKVYLKR